MNKSTCIICGKEGHGIMTVSYTHLANELRYVARLSTYGTEPKGNRVWIGRLVACRRPETGWPIHGQVEALSLIHIYIGVFMYIKSLQLINYRNYENLSIKLCPNVNVFIGDMHKVKPM